MRRKKEKPKCGTYFPILSWVTCEKCNSEFRFEKMFVYYDYLLFDKFLCMKCGKTPREAYVLLKNIEKKDIRMPSCKPPKGK